MLSDCEQRANSVNKSGRAHFNMRRPVDTRKYQRGPGNTRKYAINTVDTCEHRKTLSHPIPRPPIRANTRPPRIILPPCLQPSVSIIDSTPPGWVSHSFALLVINPLFSLRLHSFSLSYHPLSPSNAFTTGALLLSTRAPFRSLPPADILSLFFTPKSISTPPCEQEPSPPTIVRSVHHTTPLPSFPTPRRPLLSHESRPSSLQHIRIVRSDRLGCDALFVVEKDLATATPKSLRPRRVSRIRSILLLYASTASATR